MTNKSKLLTIAIIFVLSAGVGAYYFSDKSGNGIRTPETTLGLVDGKRLYNKQCAGCHGVNLEGQANWKNRGNDGKLPAPPHDSSGHTWHHPDQILFALTKYGPASLAGADYKTDMPGFANMMSDDEIVAVLSYIKSTWPERIRLEQERRTKAYDG